MPDASAPSPSPAPLVIVPTYDEASTIAALAEAVLALPSGFDLLVVDDGSPDGTAEIVRTLALGYPGRVHLIERAGKLGLGTAYLAGFRFALERDYAFICEMDADFSHNPLDLERLLAACRDPNGPQADLAVGSRYVGGVRVLNWPLSRLILSYGAGIYTRAITGIPVKDVTAGFKCYRRRVLESLDLGRVRSNGYAFQVEMKVRAWAAGFRLAEVPITFTERTEGQSKMSRGIVREAAWKVWELSLRRLAGRL